MARTDRVLPVAVVLTVTAGFVVPGALAWNGTGEAGLPVPTWGRLIATTVRSLVIPVVAGTLAVILAAAVVLFAYTVLSRGARRALVVFCAVPFLFPPVVIAAAVHDGLGESSLLLTCTLAALPAGLAGQVLGLRFVDAETLMLTRSLGLPVWAAWRKAVVPAWSRGAFLGSAWSVLQLFSDPGIHDVYGGNRSHLASHIFRAVSAGETGPGVMRAVLFTMVPTVLVSCIVARQRFWRGMRVGTGASRFPVTELLRSAPVPGWVKACAGVLSCLPVAAIAGVLTVIGQGAVREAPTVAHQVTPILGTVLLVAVAVPVGAVIAFGFSLALRGAGRVWRGCAVFLLLLMLFSSPTAIGAVLGMGLRRPVSMDGAVVIPALVGGGSVANGWLGLLLATLAVCVPISALVMLALPAARPSAASLSARSLGAGPLRTLFTTDVMYLKPLIVVTLCLQTGASLTSLSPLVFVQPGGNLLATPQLFNLIAGGRTDQAFSLVVVTAVVTCAAVAGVLLLIKMAFDTEAGSRNRK